jgi:insulysin
MAAAVDARTAADDARAAANDAPAAAAAAALPLQDVAKPLSDPRQYRALTLPSGLRLMVVRDADAEFAAAACSVQVGYFDDDDDLPGMAHALEHAVHLGSERFPTAEGGYKFFLGQHGGASNASTGMVHTTYHFKVAAPALGGALDRLGAALGGPLLAAESILGEMDNVHAEYARNTNSDDRKLLQLRRTEGGGAPYSKFSTGARRMPRAARRWTMARASPASRSPPPSRPPAEATAAGNIATLRDDNGAGERLPGALRRLWEERYVAGATCAAVVGPQPLDELQALASAAFSALRASPVGPDTAGATEAPAACRYDLSAVAGPEHQGRCFWIAPHREQRRLELCWAVPYGMAAAPEGAKPWAVVSHVLGHEGEGSVAHALKAAGLAEARARALCALQRSLRHVLLILRRRIFF